MTPTIHWPTDHWPITHPDQWPTRPKKPIQKLLSLIFFPLYDTLNYSNHAFQIAHDTNYSLTHRPLTHHPPWTTRPTKPTPKPLSLIFSPLYDTIQTIYFLIAHDTHHLLTHHPPWPTRPTKPTHDNCVWQICDTFSKFKTYKFHV